MLSVSIEISMSVDGHPADAADLCRWLGEALTNPEVRNTTDEIIVHTLAVSDER